MRHARSNQIIALALAGLLLAACGENSGGQARTAQATTIPPSSVKSPPANQPSAPEEPSEPATPPAGSTDVNQAPVVSGAAPAQATVGQLWAFQPLIIDPDGDAVNISAANLPAWINLDKASGRLSGTPGDGDVQTWSDIVVTVSDGMLETSLPAFSVNVIAQNAATGTATLSWLPPTQQLNGSPIEAISGYRLLFGQVSGQYGQSVTIDNPGITSYMIEGLTPGSWYFAIQTLDGEGFYGPPSAEVSKTI